MQRSGNNDGDPQMKGKPSTFNRHEDVCAIEVLTHKMLTLVLNDSVRYASTTSPPPVSTSLPQKEPEVSTR